MADEDPVDDDGIDAEDEKQILNDLRGEPNQRLLYKHKDGTYTLSYEGTKWAVKKLADKGQIIKPYEHPYAALCPIDQSYVLVSMIAQKLILGADGVERRAETDTCICATRAWTRTTLKNGRTVFDDLYFTKAVLKIMSALRSALMPLSFRKAMIEELKAIPPAAAIEPPPPPPPPPADSKDVVQPASTAKVVEQTKSTDDEGAVRQRLIAIFMVVLKGDMEKIRRHLKSWTGKEKTHDLDKTTMLALITTLHKVKDGLATMTELGVIENATDIVLTGKRYLDGQKPKTPPPSTGSTGGNAPMF